MTDAMRIELVDIPSGELTMGVPPVPANANIKRLWHTGKRVKIKPFKLGRYPVTNAQYLAFLEATGANRPENVDTEGLNAANQPVGGLSWEDANDYARWLAKRTRLHYRLPTDSEWEYAARGGRESTIFPWGDEINAEHCCYNNLPAPMPVGQYRPNGFGLYDMVGTVWEWCSDIYNEVAAGDKAANNPTGKNPALNRVLRGGSYLTTNVLNLWIAYRHEDPPDLRHACLGMRVACGPGI